MAPPPPSPIRILRSHSAQINSIYFSPSSSGEQANERLYTADADGLVVITSTRTFRALTSWKAHSAGVLGLEEWKGDIITHGRDNKLHVWNGVSAPVAVANAATDEIQAPPGLKYSLDVNALNFCRFSLLDQGDEALIAVPNLVDSAMVDIWKIPTCQRLCAAIGAVPGSKVEDPWSVGTGQGKTGRRDAFSSPIASLTFPQGSLMAIQVFAISHESRSSPKQLRILAAYENGGVCMWARTETGRQPSVRGQGWEALWQIKAHAESVMALAVSPQRDFAVSVSADNLLVRFTLQDDSPETSDEDADKRERMVVHRTKHPGNGAIAIRPDGKVFAVSGWDGKVRLYSMKSFKSLGTLEYHKGTCPGLAFANIYVDGAVDYETEDGEELEKRSRWLASGGTDKRVALWELMDCGRR